MLEEKSKAVKKGGQVGIHDPKDRVKDALSEIKQYWESVNVPARYSYAAIAEAIITRYNEELKEKKPKRIDTANLFEL